MQTAREYTITALVTILQVVPIGTNLGLLRVMWVMLNGSLLGSRGSVHGALWANGFGMGEIRRSWAALSNGAWGLDALLKAWHGYVRQQGLWQERRYGGYRGRSVDITAFWRPRLRGKVGKHYQALAGKAMPGVVFGIMVRGGAIKGERLPLLLQVVRNRDGKSDSAFQQELLREVKESSVADEVNVFDAGFGVGELQNAQVKQFVVRMADNCTLRRNEYPPYKGRGRHPQYGERIRPLARKRLGKVIAASPADATGCFVSAGQSIQTVSWFALVTPDRKVADDNPTIHLHGYTDPTYAKPLLLATDLPLPAEVVYQLYRDRWLVELPPLAAKQMIGLHRQFVFAAQARFRLPELALLVGNILAHLAAMLPAAVLAEATPFWDRTPKPTPGRLRRLLAQVLFPDVALLNPHFRKKMVVTDHLPKGVFAHRRRRAAT